MDESMDDRERIQLMESNLARMIGWVCTHDSKASFVWAIAAGMLGLLAHDSVQAQQAGAYQLVLAALPALPLLGVFYFLFHGAFPRTARERSVESPSLLFFGTVARLRAADFHDRINQLDTTGYLRDLSNQCLELATIVDVKFKFLKRAYLFLFISILPWAASIVYLRLFLASPTVPP